MSTRDSTVPVRSYATDKLPELAGLTIAAALDDATCALPARAPQAASRTDAPILSAAALRDIGRQRRENQDHCFAQTIAFPTDRYDLSLGLYVVADGMGGHQGGGFASRLALTTVVQQVLTECINPVLGGERPTPQPVLQAALQAANQAVFDAAQEAGSDMGTTCTAALVYGDEVIVAHVGDSRAYAIAGGITQLTTDHTAVGRLVAIGALSADEARDHPLANQLYRTIGQQPTVTVDLQSRTLRDETHLVLCSDGLWGMVPEQVIADIVGSASTPQAAARQLVAQANLEGGHDNISVVVVALPGAQRQGSTR